MRSSLSPKPWNVCLLQGGNSEERDVSLKSGENIGKALLESGHSVTKVDPREKSWVHTKWSSFDIAFISLHGTGGEDGAIQSYLDNHNLVYTGANALSSAVSFSKPAAKELFAIADLPTPAWMVDHGLGISSRNSNFIHEIELPIVVKPCAQGSSVGVTVVHKRAQLGPAISEARKFGDRFLMEKAILGDEWTVPVLDDLPLPPIRIRTPRTFFDYSAKYIDRTTQYEVITPEENPLVQQIMELGVRACQSLGTTGICRVDLMVDKENQPWILEVNTIPGMTDHSLVPMSAAYSGWSMPDLCERIILSAFSQHADR